MENASNTSLGKISAIVGVLAGSIGIIVSLHSLFVHQSPPDISGTWVEKSPGVRLDLVLDDQRVQGNLSAQCFADGSTRKQPLVFKVLTNESRWDGQTLRVKLLDEDNYVEHYKLRLANEKLVGTRWITEPPTVFHGTQVEPEMDEPPTNIELERGDVKSCPGFDPNYWKKVDERIKQLEKK